MKELIRQLRLHQLIDLPLTDEMVEVEKKIQLLNYYLDGCECEIKTGDIKYIHCYGSGIRRVVKVMIEFDILRCTRDMMYMSVDATVNPPITMKKSEQIMLEVICQRHPDVKINFVAFNSHV